MNVEHRTLNVQHPTRYSADFYNGGAQRLHHWTFDVRRWMFDVQMLKRMFDAKAICDRPDSETRAIASKKSRTKDFE
jgi:hypothetical protein